MDLLKKVKNILLEILDISIDEIKENSYIVRDLDMESIDFLELAVLINSEFNINVSDDDIFLRTLRESLIMAKEAKDISEEKFLKEKYPHLSCARIDEILENVDMGPVLKVADLISYIKWQYESKK